MERRLVAVLLLGCIWRTGRAAEPWVSTDKGGHLKYRTTERGDRIVDFSYAGYMGGGVRLPNVTEVEVIKPSGGDDSEAIQAAIDKVSAMPLTGRYRGAVKLAPGTFHCGSTLTVGASGVVLRGSGSGQGGTTIELTGQPHLAISVAGKETITDKGPASHIAQAYVPAGTRTITLDDASSISAGDMVRIRRVATPEWVHFMGMDGMVRNGKPEVWVGAALVTYRKVLARKGNELTLEVPLTDSYDRKYLPAEGAEVEKVDIQGDIEQVGVEHLRVVAPPREVGLSDKLYRTMSMRAVRDGWVRDLVVEDTTEGIGLGGDVARVTLDGVIHNHTKSITTSAKPADIALGGTQLLVVNCGGTGDNEFYVVTGPRNAGPNVVLDSVFHGNGHLQPHQRWSTGLLVDNVQVPEGGIDLMNRGGMGSGHGWTMGWGVAWNSKAQSFIIQNPPGAANWSIGNIGEQLTAPMKRYDLPPHVKQPDLPQGFVESAGKPVVPTSLYKAQLKERLGADALKALER